MIHDRAIPFLKCPENHFSRKLFPVRQKPDIPDPGSFRGPEGDRIDPSCSAADHMRDFPASESMFAAECAELFILQCKIRDKIERIDRPASGNSKFHKSDAPVTPAYGTAKHPSENAKGAPAQNNQCTLSTINSDSLKLAVLRQIIVEKSFSRPIKFC